MSSQGTARRHQAPILQQWKAPNFSSSLPAPNARAPRPQPAVPSLSSRLNGGHHERSLLGLSRLLMTSRIRNPIGSPCSVDDFDAWEEGKKSGDEIMSFHRENDMAVVTPSRFTGNGTAFNGDISPISTNSSVISRFSGTTVNRTSDNTLDSLTTMQLLKFDNKRSYINRCVMEGIAETPSHVETELSSSGCSGAHAMQSSTADSLTYSPLAGEDITSRDSDQNVRLGSNFLRGTLDTEIEIELQREIDRLTILVGSSEKALTQQKVQYDARIKCLKDEKQSALNEVRRLERLAASFKDPSEELKMKIAELKAEKDRIQGELANLYLQRDNEIERERLRHNEVHSLKFDLEELKGGNLLKDQTIKEQSQELDEARRSLHEMESNWILFRSKVLGVAGLYVPKRDLCIMGDGEFIQLLEKAILNMEEKFRKEHKAAFEHAALVESRFHKANINNMFLKGENEKKDMKIDELSSELRRIGQKNDKEIEQLKQKVAQLNEVIRIMRQREAQSKDSVPFALYRAEREMKSEREGELSNCRAKLEKERAKNSILESKLAAFARQSVLHVDVTASAPIPGSLYRLTTTDEKETVGRSELEASKVSRSFQRGREDLGYSSPIASVQRNCTTLQQLKASGRQSKCHDSSLEIQAGPFEVATEMDFFWSESQHKHGARSSTRDQSASVQVNSGNNQPKRQSSYSTNKRSGFTTQVQKQRPVFRSSATKSSKKVINSPPGSEADGKENAPPKQPAKESPKIRKMGGLKGIQEEMLKFRSFSQK